MKLAEKLVYLRKKQGLSQLKLAEMMNVSRQAISRWETGIAVPSAENLKYLGNLYKETFVYGAGMSFIYGSLLCFGRSI